MKQVITIIILGLSTQLFGQVIANFETWDTTYQHLYEGQMLSEFNVENPKHGRINKWVPQSDFAVCQTSDSYSGDYALILHNWYNYAIGEIRLKEATLDRPKFFQGYFKYITTSFDGLSQATINVCLTTGKGASMDTIGRGSINFDSTLVYTPFQIPIEYSSELFPDTFRVEIVNAKNYCGFTSVCNLLYLDDLLFSDVSLGVADFAINQFQIHPNPSSGIYHLSGDFNAQSTQVSVHSLSGKLLHSEKLNTNNTIDLSHLPQGIYFLELDVEGELVRKKIVKE